MNMIMRTDFGFEKCVGTHLVAIWDYFPVWVKINMHGRYLHTLLGQRPVMKVILTVGYITAPK